MGIINNRGNPGSLVWVIVNQPFKADADKNFLFSSPMGYVFDKMMREAGIPDYYAISRQPSLDDPQAFDNVLGKLDVYKPPIILAVENAAAAFLDELVPKRKKKNYNPDTDSEISKYCGSLLTCSNLKYPHYMMPIYGANTIVRQWKERDITISCDLAKAANEVEEFKKNGALTPLPKRICKIEFDTFDELLHIIRSFRDTPIISNDIETIYPREKSKWKGIHPGYPITIGLAPNAEYGISFELFRDNPLENRELWRVLNSLFQETIQLGQNFFNFDLNFYKMLGFDIQPERVYDTLIRHAKLWPELKHKLQFQTRQYTREVYYKDEGHGWSMKNMRGLKHYNCLDVCVTREIYDQQELEFDARPHLR